MPVEGGSGDGVCNPCLFAHLHTSCSSSKKGPTVRNAACRSPLLQILHWLAMGTSSKLGQTSETNRYRVACLKGKLQNRTTPFGETGGGTTMEFAAKPAVVCVDGVLVRSKQQLRGTCVEPQGETHVARAPPARSGPVVCSS